MQSDRGHPDFKEHPKKHAKKISKLVFAWMAPIFRTAGRKNEQFEMSDLSKPMRSDESAKIADRLERTWTGQLKKKHPSLLVAILKTFLAQYLFQGIFVAFFVLLRSVQPIVLKYFVDLFAYEPIIASGLTSSDFANSTALLNGTTLMMAAATNQTVHSAADVVLLTREQIERKMYYSGSVLISIPIIVMFALHHAELEQERIGMRIRSAVTSLVYRKILRLSHASLHQITAGQVINLLSNDVSRFDDVVKFLNYLFVLPVQIPLIMYLMYLEVQMAAVPGVVLMFLLTIPLQGFLGKVTSRLRLRMTQQSDHRIKLMYELVSGIKVIKMYAWEKPFELVVRLGRKLEVSTLIKLSYVRGLFLSFIMFTERVCLFLTLVVYVASGHDITAGVVFSLAQFFNILQLATAVFYPQAISSSAEVLVTIKRVQEFLVLEEQPEKTKSVEEKREEFEEEKEAKVEVAKEEKEPVGRIVLRNVNAKWTHDAPIVLRQITHKIEPGTLNAIIGPVGSGKSTILNLLIGEIEAEPESSVEVKGTISYASQEPWLFVGTVRNNILFGQEFDEDRYNAVIRVCCLENDLEQWSEQDETMIGDRGVSLSGGQRARINLARAIYRPADIYLLDDPLSAVDSHVGRTIFEQCITKFLQGKTTVLVTHQVHFLRQLQNIVFMQDGAALICGSYNDIRNAGIGNLEKSDDSAGEEQVVFATAPVSVDSSPGASSAVKKVKSETRISELLKEEEDKEIEESMSIHNSVMSPTGSGVDSSEEKRVELNRSTFFLYFQAYENWLVVTGLFAALFLGQIFCSATDYWVLLWTRAEDRESHRDFFVRIYVALICGCIFWITLRSISFYVIATKISRNLHNRMFSSLMHAPMQFFDTNPLGRILNRFSKDIGATDDRLPNFLLDFLQIFTVMCGILAMVILTNPFMVVIILILGAIFLKIRASYLRVAENLKRLEGRTKSPIFSHVSATLNGLTTIRNCGAQQALSSEFDCLQNVHSASFYLTIACTCAFGFWVDCVIVSFVACITYSFVVLFTLGSALANGAYVGLAISQSFILTGMLPYGVRKLAEVVNEMTSVERVIEYTKLEAEKPVIPDNNNDIDNSCENSDDKNSAEEPQGVVAMTPLETIEADMADDWPKTGHIVLHKYTLRYAEHGEKILKQVTIEVADGEKIGIVGRTGAGKSSMIAALFRLTSHTSGSIRIDGVDINRIPLARLRTKIAIIPQEPVLFSATVRHNLDPFQQYDDKDLWDALAEVELADSIPTLDHMVDEGGSNFSLGQRQLICLARALLRNNRILLLDEATANIDLETDALIQNTIRRKFKNCTVLTIAHRLNTVIDSDKILVLHHGVVLEYDHPHRLLQKENGALTKLIDETGASNAKQLRELAKMHYETGNGDNTTTASVASIEKHDDENSPENRC